MLDFIEFTDFTVFIIISILDLCLVVIGTLFGIYLKSSGESDKYFKIKNSSTIIDVTEVKSIIEDTEYITTTIKHKRKIEKQENEDEL